MRYKEYKKVDIPWLEEVPSHWNMNKGKHVFDISTGKLDANQGELGGKYPFFTCSQKPRRINDYAFDCEALLVSGNGNVGQTQYYKGKFNAYQRVYVLNNIKHVETSFLKWYISNVLPVYLQNRYVGSVINFIVVGDLRSFPVLIPSKEEQEQIARFLDWKINEIDRLIEMYINKISKLNDLKDVIISNYIFNGINSDIKLKKVSLSYIDQLPQNWKLEKIKYNFEIVKNIAGKEGYNVLSITQKGILIKDISKNEGQMASDYSKYQFVEIGDFAMNHMDLLTGYIDISKYFGVTSPDYRVFRIRNKFKIYDKYYLLMFQYFYKSRIFYKLGQGASHLGRWRLPSDNFLNMKIPVPSYNDQVKIVDSINSKSTILDHQIDRLKIIVDNLKQLKQSLISEVVTGKIDVRNVVIPEYYKASDIEDDVTLGENFNEEV